MMITCIVIMVMMMTMIDGVNDDGVNNKDDDDDDADDEDDEEEHDNDDDKKQCSIYFHLQAHGWLKDGETLCVPFPLDETIRRGMYGSFSQKRHNS